MAENDGLHILVIERQPSDWRSKSVEALEGAGHHVTVLDSYDFPPGTTEPDRKEQVEQFDAVVLGCAKVCDEELALIKRLLNHEQRVLVLSTSLPWEAMRLVFLAGANDATKKPHRPQRLVQLVEEVTQVSQPRDSYEEALLARKGI